MIYDEALIISTVKAGVKKNEGWQDNFSLDCKTKYFITIADSKLQNYNDDNLAN